MDKVEITPDMIEAGKYAIERRWLDFTGSNGFLLWDEVLSATFRAMIEARPLLPQLKKEEKKA